MPYQQLPGGEELFVVSGRFRDEVDEYGPGSWLRYPPGSGHTPQALERCVLYVRKPR